MEHSSKSALKLIFAVCWLATAAVSFSERLPQIITRDVLIIGGGSSGTYSAIKLRDLGKSVAVVESKAVLGGHTETWTDPVTQGKVEAGVIFFHDLEIVRKYFARFQIPLTKIDSLAADVITKFADFRTGKTVPGFTPPPINLTFPGYGAQLAKYPYLEAGFDLPEPVPEDLLLTFEKFVTKYHLEDLLFYAILYGQGLGNILHLPAIYVFKNFGLDVLRNIQLGFLTTARHNNHELYDKALAELSQDAFLSSWVLTIDRNPSGKHAKVLIQTPKGKKLILAKNVLITIPPLLKNLENFSLDHQERSLFKQFKSKGYYTGVLRHTGIPDSVSILNVGLHTPYNIPSLPGIYDLSATGIAGVKNVKYGADHDISPDKVRENILRDVKLIATEGKLNDTSDKELELTFFSSHTPFELHVDAGAIRDGFYKKLYSLQGKGKFWYSGAAFHTHDSSLLWQFSEKVISRIVK